MMPCGQLDHLPVLDVDSMRAAETTLLRSGLPSFALMKRAAKQAAKAALRSYPDADFLVLAGPGNNGGDGILAGQWIKDQGKRVYISLGQPREMYRGDAAIALGRSQLDLVAQSHVDDLLKQEKIVVIDSLFGIGLSRNLEAPYLDLIRMVNESGRPVLSIDIPSGIEADSGDVKGDAIKAAKTVTFAAAKIGHVLYPGRHYVGDLIICDIGLGPIDSKYQINGPLPVPPVLPMAHKYQRGYVQVLSSSEMAGAAMLASYAARRTGAGMVAVVGPKDVRDLHLGYQPGLVFKIAADAGEYRSHLGDRRLDVLLVGCGFDEAHGYCQAALDRMLPVILDGGALQSGLKVKHGRAVLTPHEGEFSRTFPALSTGSKLVRALKGALAANAVLVLKGPDTIIAAPDGRARINMTGDASLAVAGSGDVLAGMISGFVARGMPLFDAASVAVWAHGVLGARLGMGSVAEDIAEKLPALLKEIAGS